MLGFWIAMGRIESGLPGGTPGVIEYEFVWSAQRAARFLSEWGHHGRDVVRALLIVDYGFMAGYGTFVTLGGLEARDLARRSGRRALAAVGRVVPWFAAVAACFDALENALLLRILDGHSGSALPRISTAFASIKWVLITIAVVYLVWGTCAWLFDSLKRSGRWRSSE